MRIQLLVQPYTDNLAWKWSHGSRKHVAIQPVTYTTNDHIRLMENCLPVHNTVRQNINTETYYVTRNFVNMFTSVIQHFLIQRTPKTPFRQCPGFLRTTGLCSFHEKILTAPYVDVASVLKNWSGWNDFDETLYRWFGIYYEMEIIQFLRTRQSGDLLLESPKLQSVHSSLTTQHVFSQRAIYIPMNINTNLSTTEDHAVACRYKG